MHLDGSQPGDDDSALGFVEDRFNSIGTLFRLV